jgi:hypothetical protein
MVGGEKHGFEGTSRMVTWFLRMFFHFRGELALYQRSMGKRANRVATGGSYW